MNVKLFFLIASYLIIAFVIFYSISRRKKIIKESGKQIFSLDHNTVLRAVFVSVISIFLVFLAFRMNYNYLVTFGLCGCAIFASFIVLKDGAISSLDGVYEKALVCNGYFIKYEQIQDFPVFKLSKEDRELYAKNALIILLQNKTKIELVFNSEKECSNVVEQLVKLKVLKK